MKLGEDDGAKGKVEETLDVPLSGACECCD